ncbi:MAG: hypothetical protein ACE10G_01120 [Gemmatimonadales bacterium]
MRKVAYTSFVAVLVLLGTAAPTWAQATNTLHHGVVRRANAVVVHGEIRRQVGDDPLWVAGALGSLKRSRGGVDRRGNGRAVGAAQRTATG